MPEIKTGFESCLAPEPIELKFLGKGDVYIGTIRLKHLVLDELIQLRYKNVYENIAKSIIEWDLKDDQGNILKVTPENIKNLHPRIQLQLNNSMNELSWGSGVEEKNSETQSVSS